MTTLNAPIKPFLSIFYPTIDNVPNFLSLEGTFTTCFGVGFVGSNAT